MSRAHPAATAGISTPAWLCIWWWWWRKEEKEEEEPRAGTRAHDQDQDDQGQDQGGGRFITTTGRPVLGSPSGRLLTKASLWPELQMRVST